MGCPTNLGSYMLDLNHKCLTNSARLIQRHDSTIDRQPTAMLFHALTWLVGLEKCLYLFAVDEKEFAAVVIRGESGSIMLAKPGS